MCSHALSVGRPHRRSPGLSRLLWLTLATLCSVGCRRERPELEAGSLVISVEQHSAWVRQFNPFSPNARRFTRAGIYEPLMIRNSITGELTPWLATALHWSEDYSSLSFDVREGVRFSDGTALSARDVVSSFEITRRHPALDTSGLWSALSAVEALSSHKVRFHFKEPYKPKLDDIAHQPIVPAHIWSKVEDPVTFTNPEPVGTGPFTEVLAFRSQLYELGKNPHYWQKGQVKLRSLRFPAFPSNDQANLALVTGEVDWAGNFVPAIERTFVAVNPQRHHYWFPLVGSMVNLIPNSTRGLLSEPRFRKALSYAIDRERLVEVAMYGYTRPADSTGLTDTFKSLHDRSLVEREDWTRYQPDRAESLLSELKLVKRADGRWAQGEGGEPLSLEIDVVSGWSDWVRAAQVIASDLKRIGVEAKVRTSEFSAWFERVRSGDFSLAIGWADERGSLYEYYRWLMSAETVAAPGEPAIGHFNRLGDAQADRWLSELKRGVSEERRGALARRLQARFAELAPTIPLFPNPQWGAASSARVSGFPSREDPYAPLSPNRSPECLLVLTRLTPRAPTLKGGER